MAKKGRRLDPPAERSDWFTLADMGRIRRRNAIRQVSVTSSTEVRQDARQEIAELNEQINVDVDVSQLYDTILWMLSRMMQFHASLWLSEEEVTILDLAMDL